MLVFFSSLNLVFQQLRKTEYLSDFQIASLLFFVLEIIYNTLTVKSTAGKKLNTLETILHEYLHTNLVIDIINVLIIIIDLSVTTDALLFIRLFVITKIPQCL